MFNTFRFLGSCFLAKTRDSFFAGVDVKGGCEVSRAVKLFDNSNEDSEMSKYVVLKLGSPQFRQTMTNYHGQHESYVSGRSCPDTLYDVSNVKHFTLHGY